MYLTQTDIANARVNKGRILTDTELLVDLIKKDRDSQIKINMRDGVKYYEGDHDILRHSFQKYWVNGEEYEDNNKSNNRLVHTLHKLMVDQKAGYIAKNPVTMVVSNDEDAIVEQMGTTFHDKLNDWIVGASNMGVDYVHPYYNEKGDFKTTIISAIELIPIYDTNYEAEIVEMIRYYKIQVIVNGETQDRTRVEWWDEKEVTFYIETDQGLYIKEPVEKNEQGDEEGSNPRGHWITQNSASNLQTDKSWGKVPFVPLYNNSKQLTDLQPIKTLIDDYDFNVSDASNNLADLQEAIWVLSGYEGEELAEFQQNLKKYKAINVSEDGSVAPQTLDIPVIARDSLLERHLSDVFMYGMGVDMSRDAFNNSPSGVSLKFLFTLLDTKARTMERKLQTSLQELMWFIITSLGKDPEKIEVTFTFDYSMLVNEAEIVDSLSKSEIPPEDYFKKHPFVSDVDEAVKWKAKQVEEFIPLDDNVT